MTVKIYEKVNGTKIRLWLREDVYLKTDLEAEQANIVNILTLSNAEIQLIISDSKVGVSIQQFRNHFQGKLNNVNYLLALFNNPTEQICFDKIIE